MIGTVLDDRYEIVDFVGKGGMALVYKAMDKRTKHFVAVKILRPEFVKDEEFVNRFNREATAASKMSHHNIVNLLDVGTQGNLPYLVMEYVEGTTLKDIIKKRGALQPDTAVQIAIRILSALQHAHKNGIIHRDIKPQNVLVHAEGLIKVADFGIARVAGSDTISKDDSVMGSVHYFSPEQAKGEAVTFASDLYSVGIVLYEMLTGYVPFDGETPVSIAMQHISAIPRPMDELKPGIPRAIERVVMQALQKNPTDRYQSAYDMANALQEALHMKDDESQPVQQVMPAQSVTPKKPSQPKKKRKNKKKNTVAFWSGVATLVLLIVMFVIGFNHLEKYVLNMTSAPYVLDEQEDAAVRLITKAQLTAKISRVSDNLKPAGTVIMQSPEYDVSMKKGETLLITVSTGPEEQPVPNIRDMTREAAENELMKYGFTLAPCGRELSDKPLDVVLTQQPAENEMLQVGGIVQVTLSGGRIELPNLVSMDQDEALFLIQQKKLNLTEIQEFQTGDETVINKVAAQQFFDDSGAVFAPGDFAMEGTSVKLVVYVAEAEEMIQEGTETP